ncbi:DHDDS family protein [Megaselia abdita]
MTSWISEYKYSWLEKIAINVIKCGNIPNHIAIIMDGNRRFARSNNIEKIDGHTKGFDKLAECLKWSLDIGIKEVTAFAFSIENFKRSDKEIEDLMTLATYKFEEFLQENDKLKENGVRLRVIGDLSLLPPKLQVVVSKAVLETEENDKLFLNIAFAYTFRNELISTVQKIIENNDSHTCEINEELIGSCLQLQSTPDLLLRTSGENRLSDFLMWQLSSSTLYFTNILWPQVNIWNFLAGILHYQLITSNSSDMRPNLKVPLSQNSQHMLATINAAKKKDLILMSQNG